MKITDKMRLDWLLNFSELFKHGKCVGENWDLMIEEYYAADEYKSPRKALDAAMRANSKHGAKE